MAKYNDHYLGFMGKWPQRIPQWESLYCPDALTQITKINYYERPRSCVKRLIELYPLLWVKLPETDEPVTHQNNAVSGEENEHKTVRWGAGQTWRFDWGTEFKTPEDVLNYSPLEHLDLRGAAIPEARDYSDEEKLYEEYRALYPAEWGDTAPEGATDMAYFYNTLIIWPIVTFGYELFLETCMEPEFGRIMDEFAEITRRVMKVFSRLPVNFVNCHDDIVTTNGPVIPPRWLRKYIFPHYEEWWSMLKAAGKEVIFTTDGCVDMFADDIFACGARGIRTEPYTDFKAIARRYPDAFLAGEGDVRVLMRNDPDEIREMVKRMNETGHMCGGYFMQIGNLITHDVSAEALKLYFDLCHELGYR